VKRGEDKLRVKIRRPKEVRICENYAGREKKGFLDEDAREGEGPIRAVPSGIGKQ